MPVGLPRSIGALLAAALGLAGLALFFGDGSTYPPLVWIGTLAVLAAGVVLALGWAAQLDRVGWAFVGLLAAFVVWNGLSILWSYEPDRSWEYFNRGVVYLAFGLVGLAVGAAVPRSPRLLAFGVLALFGAALLWALAGKVVPNLYPDGERAARLRAPLEYWNALALLCAMTLPLALWAAVRREHARVLRVGAVLLVFVTTVALLLTYSRGGSLVALFAAVVCVAVLRERVDVVAALLVSLPPAVVLAVWAFTQPGLVDDGQSYDRRLTDGLQFGVGLVLAGAVVGVLAYLGLTHEERWRPRISGRVSGPQLAAFSAVALLVAVLAASRGDPVGWVRDGFREFTNPTSQAGAGPERLANFNSNSRWTWWEEAWELFRDEPLTGTGAGSFSIARRPIRHNTTVATEPHNLALQFLAETGFVGFLLAGGAAAAAGIGIVRALRRLDEADAAAGLALSIVVVAYLAHALVDYDWDFVGVTAPLFLVLGGLVAAGRPVVGRRDQLFAAGAVVVSLAFVGSLAAPWLADRDVTDAYAALDERRPEEARDDAQAARSWNPLSVEPLFAEAAAEEALRRPAAALDRYVKAVELQPRNPRTWFELGRFELRVGLREAAIRHLMRSRELDRFGPAVPYLQNLGL
jgi:tetratricopeptide (TPR) repeat protein